jgi:rare lipoprotein A
MPPGPQPPTRPSLRRKTGHPLIFLPDRKTRRSVQAATRTSAHHAIRRAMNVSLFAVGALFSFGCAARNPVADRQPPPTQPAPTPDSTAEAAKRSTDVTPAPAPASGVVTPAKGKRAKAAPPPAPVGYNEEGNASWYGVPFHGRHSSNGEIYDMYKLTAAHRTLPFDTVVRVTNVNNGKSAIVRITDRGPFVENRIIDLSFAAAQQIESVGPGVVPIRLEVISGSVDPTTGFFTVQVGAFRERSNAEHLREKLNASYSPIYIQNYDSPDGTFYRVRVGRIAGEDAARQYANQLHTRDGFTTFVVRLDEAAAPKE